MGIFDSIKQKVLGTNPTKLTSSGGVFSKISASIPDEPVEVPTGVRYGETFDYNGKSYKVDPLPLKVDTGLFSNIQKNLNTTQTSTPQVTDVKGPTIKTPFRQSEYQSFGGPVIGTAQKILSEFPERLAQTVADIYNTVRKGGVSDKAVFQSGEKKVSNAFSEAAGIADRAVQDGMSEPAAKALGTLYGVSAIIADLAPLADLSARGVLAATKFNAPLEESLYRLGLNKGEFSISAWQKNTMSAAENIAKSGDVVAFEQLVNDYKVIARAVTENQPRSTGVLKLLQDTAASMRTPLGGRGPIFNIAKTGEESLPGFRWEPGQAQPMGASIRRVEPVGYGDDATKGIDPLAQEARKYKTAEEFVKAPDEIVKYVDELDRSIENIDFVKPEDRGILPFTKKQINSNSAYVRQTVNIDDLIKKDADLREYVEAGDQRYPSERDFFDVDTPIVVGKNGEVYDGMNRILTKKQNGETTIEAFVGTNQTKSQLTDIWNKANMAEKSQIKETKLTNPAEVVAQKIWYRGVDKRNAKQGDRFYSTDPSISGDYGKVNTIKEVELPQNPFIIGDKDVLAELIGFKGDPYLMRSFDDEAKKYAKTKGHDSIMYESGTFDEPELHLFDVKPTRKVVGTARVGDKTIELRKGGKISTPPYPTVGSIPVSPIEEPKISPRVGQGSDIDETPTEIRVDYREAEKANKKYLKVVKKEAEADLPNKTILSIRKQENLVKDMYSAKQKEAEEILNNTMLSLELAEAGERVATNPYFTDFRAKRSTFPTWLPEDVRNHTSIDPAIEKVKDLSTLHYPEKLTAKRQAKIIDLIFDQIDLYTNISTKDVRKGILDNYEPEVRKAQKEERIIEKTTERTAKHISELIGKDEKKRAHMERIKAAEEESARKLAEEQKYKQTYDQKLTQAKKDASKGTGFIASIRNMLRPIKGVDSTTKKILENWLIKKRVGREIAQEAYNVAASKGTQNFQEIIDYQAGKQTPYIREAFDDLGSEAKRRGLEFDFRDNYLSQVWENTDKEFTKAASGYMKEQGLTDEEIKAYLAGEELPKDKSLRLKLKPNFVKERFWPDYETGMKHGLRPKYRSPAKLIAYYRESMETAIANRELVDELKKEVKLLSVDEAPDSWEPVTLRFSREGLYAPHELARIINGKFRNEMYLTGGQRIAKVLGGLSGFIQEVRLSAGVPFTNINYFSIGQANKLLTTALGEAVQFNFKEAVSSLRASFAFIRANSNKASIQYFYDNRGYIAGMARQGIDISGRVGSYENAYTSLWQQIKERFPSSPSIWGTGKAVKESIGVLFNKSFNEKTFGSMMAQVQVQIFKDTYDGLVKKGITPLVAEKQAGDVVKNYMGLIIETGRGKTADDWIKTFFFAPKFREGLINIFINSGKAFTTQFKNPTYSKLRSFILGMAIVYGLYEALNYKLNKHHLWDNPPGREFALRIPLAGENVLYTEFMPSVLAFPRNMASGVIAVARGDEATAKQKFGSLFSMGIKIFSEILANKDYFGRQIYKETDTPKMKLAKAAEHVGLSMSHPYFSETYKYWQGKSTLLQAISYGAELPLKFGTLTKEQTAEYYDMLDRKEDERARAKEKLMPTYNKIQEAFEGGNTAQAIDLYRKLSSEEKKIYSDIKSAEKRANTTSKKPALYALYINIQKLLKEGRSDEAVNMYKGLSAEDQRIFGLIRDQNQ